MNEIIIYTDGSCRPNPGRGGWCGILLHKTSNKCFKKRVFGNKDNTTNNIMELTAIKESLSQLKQPEKSHVILVSDSSYSINVLNGKYQAKKNFELINEIKMIMDKIAKIELRWVKGHKDNVFNIEADEVAQEVAIDPEDVYEHDYCEEDYDCDLLSGT